MLLPPLHLSVVAIEKGAFWSPSTRLSQRLILDLFSLSAVIKDELSSCFTSSFTQIKLSPVKVEILLVFIVTDPGEHNYG